MIPPVFYREQAPRQGRRRAMLERIAGVRGEVGAGGLTVRLSERWSCGRDGRLGRKSFMSRSER